MSEIYMGAQEREVKGRSSGDPEINQAQQGLMPAGVAEINLFQIGKLIYLLLSSDTQT